MRASLVAPGRWGRLVRLVPEACAVAIYAVFALALALALILTPLRVDWSPLRNAMEIALRYALPATYLVAGFLLFVVPLGLAAAAFARERDRGTMDALVLTPLDHGALVWGRFWRTLLPWLRLVLYLAPLYVLMAGSVFAQGAANSGEFSHPLVSAFLPKGVLCWIMNDEIRGPFRLFRSGFALAFLRAANDLSVLLFVMGAALYVSARARNMTRTFVASYLAIPLLVGTVLALDFWWAFSYDATLFVGSHMEQRTAAAIYVFLAISLMFARWLLAFGLVARAARNFDAYATGERPARIGWRRLAAKAGGIVALAGVAAYLLMPQPDRISPRTWRCVNHLTCIAMACRHYAQDHGGIFPPDFNALYPKYVDDARAFICASKWGYEEAKKRKDEFTPARTDFVYITGLRDMDPSRCVFAYCRPGNHGGEGTAVGFLDMHAEWMVGDNYLKYLADTRAYLEDEGRESRLLYENPPPPLGGRPRRWLYWTGGALLVALGILLWSRHQRKLRARAAA